MKDDVKVISLNVWGVVGHRSFFVTADRSCNLLIDILMLQLMKKLLGKRERQQGAERNVGNKK